MTRIERYAKKRISKATPHQRVERISRNADADSLVPLGCAGEIWSCEALDIVLHSGRQIFRSRRDPPGPAGQPAPGTDCDLKRLATFDRLVGGTGQPESCSLAATDHGVAAQREASKTQLVSQFALGDAGPQGRKNPLHGFREVFPADDAGGFAGREARFDQQLQEIRRVAPVLTEKAKRRVEHPLRSTGDCAA